MMRKFVTMLVFAASALALTACAGGVGSLFAPAEVKTYNLTAPQDVGMRGKPHRRNLQLIVPEPTSLRWLDTDKLTVKPNAAEINYMGEAQWSDRLPRLLQARLIETLERSGRFRAVTRPGSGIDPDYQVLIEIRDFEAIVAEPSEVYINLSVKLVPARSGRTAAERVFEARAPLSSVDAPSVAAALNVALGQVLQEIAQWAAGR
jgi:cholesterol transport system auxiliary component